MTLPQQSEAVAKAQSFDHCFSAIPGAQPIAEVQRCLSRSDLVAEVDRFIQGHMPQDQYPTSERWYATSLLSLFCQELMRDIP